ncbi:MAG: hypothetical protein ACLFU9_04700 [Candidatus Bathyarchaeia archaeon]
MDIGELAKFKWILILELAFAGAYVSITRGLFVIFLVSTGYAIEGISFVMLVSAAIAVLIGGLINRYPSFIINNVKTKVIAFHGLERLMWFFIPILSDPLFVLIFYSIFMIFSFFVSVFMNFTVYGSLDEVDLKDILAKRSAVGGASSIIGFVLGVFLLAFLPMEGKFIYIFSIGAVIGLLSTFVVMFLNLAHLEGAPLPKGVEQPEKVFSTSLFFVILLTGGNLLGIIWIPYLMDYLKGPDYLAASMGLLATVASIGASLVWRGKSLKTLRTSHILSALSPLIIWFTTFPSFHLIISAFNSFVYTGANFLGNFLFAKYKDWFGAVRSSILLAILGNAAILLAAPMGMIIKQDYILAFSTIFIILIISVLFTSLGIPEVAVVSEETARTYSFILYRNSLTGYNVSVEISKETALVTLKLLTTSLVLIALYVIYRLLTIIMARAILI